MRTLELQFDLPSTLIAQSPSAERDASRLLVCRGGQRDNAMFGQLHDHLPAGSLLVVNESRVLRARILTTKNTGGRVELLLIERRAEGVWTAFAKPKKALRVGMQLTTEHGAFAIEVSALLDERLIEVRFVDSTVSDWHQIERAGVLPLPPYIQRDTVAEDDTRYQTVFANANKTGSVAAPTAGLHFSPELCQTLERQGHSFERVCLHVGPGTFLPITSDTLEGHVMHEEAFAIPAATARRIAQAKRDRQPIIAVGTTSVRTLEASAEQLLSEAYLSGNRQTDIVGRTSIFIQPGYSFRVVDGIITNFHLPGSTLLALVMAKLGIEQTRAAYQHAIDAKYRFFSYGDAMYIAPDTKANA